MGPIEALYISIALIFGLIGIVRGYQRELGNTIVIMYVIAAMGFLDDRVLNNLFNQVGGSIFGVDETLQNQFLLVIYTAVFVLVVFWTYQGKTFDFGGQPAKGCLGFVFGLLVGLINGYLVAGTLWYYADKFEYPFPLFSMPLTAAGAAMVNYLPQTVIQGEPVYWALPATALLLLRIWK